MFYQYQVIEVIDSINAVIKAGMQGVILEILGDNNYEVEFLNADGINYEFEGSYMFTLNTSQLKAIG